MTENAPPLLKYYADRAHEYERVYEKPERQQDIATLREQLRNLCRGKHVLEIACGTGFWTQPLSYIAARITAIDASPEVLEFARSKTFAPNVVELRVGDAFALHRVHGRFEMAIAGFWFSHIRVNERRTFLSGVHERLGAGAQVVLFDNRYVHGSNHAISRIDDDGNSYQQRVLQNGTQYEVLKNFPVAEDLRAIIEGCGGTEVTVEQLEYFWLVRYRIAHAPSA